MKPLDLVLAQVRVGKSADPRICIVIEVGPTARVTLLPCSAQLALYRPGRDFLLLASHPDFPATRLPKTSYAMDVPFIEVEGTAIKKVYGRLTGELARDFDRWLGPA